MIDRVVEFVKTVHRDYYPEALFLAIMLSLFWLVPPMLIGFMAPVWSLAWTLVMLRGADYYLRRVRARELNLDRSRWDVDPDRGL